MKISDLVKESFGTAVEKGWWPEVDLRNVDRLLPEKVALIHSELSEALDEVIADHAPALTYLDDGKPCGVPIEMADVIIRIGDYVGALNIDLSKEIIDLLGINAVPSDLTLDDIVKAEAPDFWARDFAGRIGEMHSTLSKVLETWRKGKPVAECFADFTVDVINFCAIEGIPLEAATLQKLAFNKTRSFRHGGKKA